MRKHNQLSGERIWSSKHMETLISLEQQHLCHKQSYFLSTTLWPPSASCLSNQQAATVTGGFNVTNHTAILSSHDVLNVLFGKWMKRQDVCMVPLWVPSSWQGSSSMKITDATCTTVIMRGRSKLRTKVRTSMYYTLSHPKTTKRALWTVPVCSQANDICTKTIRDCKCDKFQESLMCGHVFHFLSVFFVFPSWANPDDATTHMGPLWKAVSQTDRRFKENSWTVSTHSFPAFSFFLPIWPSSCMDLTSPWPCELCSVQSTSCFWHVVEKIELNHQKHHQTHCTGGGNFVSQLRRRVLEDYKGSEFDTLNSHSKRALFSLGCNDRIKETKSVTDD